MEDIVIRIAEFFFDHTPVQAGRTVWEVVQPALLISIQSLTFLDAFPSGRADSGHVHRLIFHLRITILRHTCALTPSAYIWGPPSRDIQVSVALRSILCIDELNFGWYRLEFFAGDCK